MSIAAMASCWGDRFPVDDCPDVHPATVRLVALAIADVVNDTHGNEFFAALSRLAEKVCLHRDTVRLVMRHLSAVGVLAVLEAPSPQGGKPGRYRWIWEGQLSTGAGSDPENLAENPRGSTRGDVNPQVRPRGKSARPRGDNGVNLADCSATYTNRTQMNNCARANETVDNSRFCGECGGTLFVSREVVNGLGQHVWESEPCPRCHPLRVSASRR